MKTQIKNQKPTNDDEVNNLVESYFSRQTWETTYINPKNLVFNGK